MSRVYDGIRRGLRARKLVTLRVAARRGAARRRKARCFRYLKIPARLFAWRAIFPPRHARPGNPTAASTSVASVELSPLRRKEIDRPLACGPNDAAGEGGFRVLRISSGRVAI